MVIQIPNSKKKKIENIVIYEYGIILYFTTIR